MAPPVLLAHVFGDAKASSPEEVIKLWNQVKAEEKKKKASLQ